MSTLSPPRRRGFTTLALLTSGALLFSSTALGIRALSESVSTGLEQVSRRPSGPFTQAPTRPFLGAKPGRDPQGRGGLWSAERREEAARASGPALWAGPAALTGSHTLAVAPEPGGAQPWEGSAGGVNTGNGNRLTKLHLLDWKVRGGMSLDFTLYHNSQTNYSDELGEHWTWTYDVYVNNLTTNPVLHWGDGTSVPFAAPGGSPALPITYTTPAGIHDTLVQNVGGTWTVTRKDGTKYFMNAAGFLTKVMDRNANAITLTLDSANYVTKITDPTGRYVNVSVNGSHKFTGITDQTGRTWSFTLDGSGDLSTVTWPDPGDGLTYTDAYAYSAHQIATHTDRRGKAWTATYNTDGSVASETDPLGHATTYGYGSSATTITDALSHVWTHNYSSGALASQVDPSSFSVSYTARNANHDVTSTTDSRGKIWANTFDSNGNVLTSTDPLGHTTTTTYNGFSQPLTVTDALSHTATVAYDSSGNVLTVTDARGKTVRTNAIGSYGLVTSETDALGKATSFAYTTDGDVQTATDPTSIITTMGYDALGKPTTVTDAAGKTTTTDYDGWDRPVSVTYPPTSGTTGASSDTSYYATGQTKTTTDELGHVTTLAYDDAGRLTSETNPRGDVESYGYDNADRRTSVTNGRGKTRTYTFTSRGDVTSLTMPDGAVETWAYDGAGNVTSYVNPLSQTILYTFDDAGRQTFVDYPTGTDTFISYDNADRRTGVTDATGTSNWSYDAANRETYFSSPQGAFTRGYDDAGRRTTLTGAGLSRTWVYDDAGRVLSLTNEFSEVTSQVYDAVGRLSKASLGNGQVSVYGYDTRGRQTSITHKVSNTGATISTESYVYDDAGNLSSKTVDGVTTTYGYDLADQITSEGRTGYSAAYTYDANGNRTSKTLGGVTDTYTIDDGDKLTSIMQGGTTVKSYTYDAAGRTKTVVSSAGTTTLNYDYESRVTGITYPSSATNSFVYNGLDSRVGRTDSSGTRGYRRDGADATSTITWDGSAQYTPGASQRRSGATIYELSDRLGTVSRQTSPATATLATRTYDAFGLQLASTGTPAGPFGFAGAHGYQEDADSGLKLLGYRYFDASTGRYLTRDKIKDGRNWYSYCANNPLKVVDPDGLKPGEKYDSQDAAATAALQDITQTSQDEMHEYGGLIYQNPDGSWSYTKGYTLTPPSESHTNPWLARKDVPEFAIIHGTYHTHPFRKGAIGGDYYNDDDKNVDDRYKKTGYIGAGEKGVIKKYEPVDLKKGERPRSGLVIPLPGNALEKDPNKRQQPNWKPK